MIVETALRIAGAGSHLVHVARHTGVLHVYTGPLTPSGRYVPRSGRTVCRAHTRRLTVLPTERRSSLAPVNQHRLCARCSARLEGLVNTTISSNSRRAEPTTRDDYRRLHADTTPHDVALALEFAETAEEVDAAAHLSLVLFGHVGCTRLPVTRPDGRQIPPLHQLVRAARGRFVQRSRTDEAFDDLVTSGYAHHKARRHQLYAEREERIRRVGITNATR